MPKKRLIVGKVVSTRGADEWKDGIGVADLVRRRGGAFRQLKSQSVTSSPLWNAGDTYPPVGEIGLDEACPRSGYLSPTVRVAGGGFLCPAGRVEDA